jgi:hypothetical protein
MLIIPTQTEMNLDPTKDTDDHAFWELLRSEHRHTTDASGSLRVSLTAHALPFTPYPLRVSEGETRSGCRCE